MGLVTIIRISLHFTPSLNPHPSFSLEIPTNMHEHNSLVYMRLRESHDVILGDRVVPASQVPFPGEPSGQPGNGT